ncbi:hypothetical protein DPMN_175742 [Dreissena polymorpha]|uniref:Uncharacterized protein n=1 Tax=Dreissena polymorpha TaxID=45954 RepID=A0A9D4E9M7_DREPO|nr:hypothetical protein DPMN_175742 [Dreissena polymorpha]
MQRQSFQLLTTTMNAFGSSCQSLLSILAILSSVTSLHPAWNIIPNCYSSESQNFVPKRVNEKPLTLSNYAPTN